ncbi:hypothetical protein ACFLZP_01015 [Patescibacteria group bacterium]
MVLKTAAPLSSPPQSSHPNNKKIRIIAGLTTAFLLGGFLGFLLGSNRKPPPAKESPPKPTANIPTPTDLPRSALKRAVDFNLDIKPLLEEFAKQNWTSVLPNYQQRFGTADQLLLEALNQPKSDLLARIKKEQVRLDSVPLADAPDARAAVEADTKLCLAKAVLEKNYHDACQVSKNYPQFPSWESVDDINATAQVFPYFLAGFAHHQDFREDNWTKRDHYLSIVTGHEFKCKERYGDSLIKDDEIYQKILSLTKDILLPEGSIILRFPTIDWTDPVKQEEIPFHKEGETVFKPGYHLQSKKVHPSFPTQLADEFFAYYRNWLETHGWKQTMFASTVGSSFGYQKGDRFFNFGIPTALSKDASGKTGFQFYLQHSLTTPFLTKSQKVDLPRLYPDIEWKTTESGKIVVYRLEPYGPIELEGFTTESGSLKKYPQAFFEYYKQQLEEDGWKLTMATSGERGEFYGYEKNGRYVHFGVWGVPGDPPFIATVQHN